ncbi:MAG TPA: hypothetical protein VFQ91_14750 [Bryobacteraceae bacterium]|nr:hypothetical protein [Bryobacteraceae bacterium]
MPRRLLLLPPLAFARLGLSATPVDWVLWGPNDTSIDGPGKTTLFACEGLDAAGTPLAKPAEELVFRDGGAIRPVCPYFELHEQLADGSTVPVTPEILEPELVTWTVSLANWKAYYRTQAETDQVQGTVTIAANQAGAYPILGVSPGGELGLVLEEAPVLLGIVEVEPPQAKQPYRVRLWPPRGRVYGPTNIHERTDLFQQGKTPDSEFEPVIARLNPDSVWATWRPSVDDEKNRQYLLRLTMRDSEGRSLGLLDDTSDGLVLCQCADEEPAQARVSVSPPHLAPDRRYLISCADGLKDREDREQPLPDPQSAEAEELVLDILERVLETVDFMNLEALVQRYEAVENPQYALGNDRGWNAQASDTFDVESMREQTLERFPLSSTARRKHRQLMSIDLLKRFLLQRPALLQELLRPPVGDNPFYNRQMPPLQRGSDARPLHLTRRQYDLVMQWANALSQS